MMKKLNIVIQLGLISSILGLTSVNTVMAWQDYQAKLAFKTDSSAGKNLAERYLVLGSWPASRQDNTAISQYHKFEIKTPPKTQSSLSQTSGE